MAWKSHFSKGVAHSREARYEDALLQFNEAIFAAPTEHVLYDSRAFVYEKLELLNEALTDAKKAIELAPDRWQGYARAAPLLARLSKHGAAIAMADTALSLMAGQDVGNHTRMEVEAIKHNSHAAFQDRAHKKRRNFGVLPVEIIRQIFITFTFNKSSRAVTLSHISQSWRAIALSCPDLWCTLSISKWKPKDQIFQWIKRSHGCIARIVVDGPSSQFSVPIFAPKYWPGMRWDTLVAFQYHSSVSSMPSQIKGARNLLELDLNVTEPEARYTLLSSQLDADLFRNWNLRSLKLQLHGWDIAAVSHMTRLTNLEIISLRTPWGYQADLIHAVASNPHLQSIVIQGSSRDFGNLPDNPPKHLRVMERLEHIEFSMSFTSFFHNFAIPAISTLVLTGLEPPMDHILEAVAKQTAGQLTHLHIAACPQITAGCVIALLRKSSDLRSLGITHIYADVVSTVLKTLAAPIQSPDGSSTFLCPALVAMNISSTDVKTGPIAQLIESRIQNDISALYEEINAQAKTSCKIKSLIMNDCKDVDAYILPWVRSKVERVSYYM